MRRWRAGRTCLWAGLLAVGLTASVVALPAQPVATKTAAAYHHRAELLTTISVRVSDANLRQRGEA